MWMHQYIEKVAARLDHLGVQFELKLCEPLAGAEAVEARDAVDSPWPAQLWELLTEFGNGFEFRWPANEVDAEPCCEIEFAGWRQIHQERGYLLAFLDELDDQWFARVGDPELARMQARLARSWFPILTDANGDQIMLDARTGHVRLYLHDWFDGGSGDNGFFMAESLSRFFQYWSACCFAQTLGTLDTVVGPYGVRWECPPEYRIGGW